MPDFTHLHVHTDASLLDGMGTVGHLLDHAKGIGLTSLAMTDHGTLANAVTFSIEAKRRGIKPILGLEGYIAFDGEIGHITLLSDGDEGWNSLVKLNSLAHASAYKKPAFTIDELLSSADGLVCLTGCVASPFHRLPFSEAVSLGSKFKRAFGHRFFAENMYIGDSRAWTRPSALSEELNIRKVVTNDAHFPTISMGELHPILTSIKAGFHYESKELYVKSHAQMIAAMTEAGVSKSAALEMLGRTAKIANLLGEVNLKKAPSLPHLGTSKVDMHREARGTIRAHRCLSGPQFSEYDERLNHEIRTVSAMGFLDYFAILKDVVDYARSEHVQVGPGRGSGAGSLLLYFLGITSIDPIEHGLQFERFLNPERVSMPDVDIDFESERRQLVMDYAEKKFDAIPIATYSRYSHRSLVRDLGRYFRMGQDTISALADVGADDPKFDEVCSKYPRFEAAYGAFLGQIRHKGKHAGGVAITTTNVPIERVGDSLAAAWAEGGSSDLSYAGIVKFDFLGLSILTALRRLEEKYGITADSCKSKHLAFSIFKTGDLSGIFQFAGSKGIRDLTVRLQPETLHELTAINALYRPGALASGATNRYPTPVDVPGSYRAVLKETHGAIVYQEQVMEIYRITVDGTLAEADTMRKIIAKPKPENVDWVKSLEEIRKKFFEGCKSHLGFSRRNAEHWWGELETHSSYSFNKSHATAYAQIAWECAWWKYSYPGDFYAEMLNIDQEHQQLYVSEALLKSIKIAPPNVETSRAIYWSYDTKTGIIYMPLKSIKFMGAKGAEYIEIERKENGPFRTLEEFMRRVPKRIVRGQARSGLWALNGFSSLTTTTTFSIEDIEKLLGIKFEGLSSQQAQLKSLGFVIPTGKQLVEAKKLEEQGYTCGIVSNIEERSSKYGPYLVVRLSPYASFWTRSAVPGEGSFIAVEMGNKGKAKTIKRISV